MKICPYCQEEVRERATVCPYCCMNISPTYLLMIKKQREDLRGMLVALAAIMASGVVFEIVKIAFFTK